MEQCVSRYNSLGLEVSRFSPFRAFLLSGNPYFGRSVPECFMHRIGS
jgi:hypothetical protein